MRVYVLRCVQVLLPWYVNHIFSQSTCALVREHMRAYITVSTE